MIDEQELDKYGIDRYKSGFSEDFSEDTPLSEILKVANIIMDKYKFISHEKIFIDFSVDTECPACTTMYLRYELPKTEEELVKDLSRAKINRDNRYYHYLQLKEEFEGEQNC